MQLLTCERCGHNWLPRTLNRPRCCAKCNSPYWDVPAKRKVEPKQLTSRAIAVRERQISTAQAVARSQARLVRNPTAYSAAFEAFWLAYPRKTAKGAAWQAFARLKPTDELLQAMQTALDWQRHQPKWAEDDGQFVPHASTWLNQRRWEDEPFHVEPSTSRPAYVPGRSKTADTIEAGKRVLAERLARLEDD